MFYANSRWLQKVLGVVHMFTGTGDVPPMFPPPPPKPKVIGDPDASPPWWPSTDTDFRSNSGRNREHQIEFCSVFGRNLQLQTPNSVEFGRIENGGIFGQIEGSTSPLHTGGNARFGRFSCHFRDTENGSNLGQIVAAEGPAALW